MALTGECFCGEIRYEITGVLVDPLSCHCSRCRKAFSSQSSNYVRVSTDDFRWVSGEENLTSYIGKHGFGLLFCSTCGSTLCGTINNSIHGISLGCLNEEPDLDEIHERPLLADTSRWWHRVASGCFTPIPATQMLIFILF